MRQSEPPDIVESIVDTIGNTPMVSLKVFNHFQSQFYGKIESFNPGGSVKDRIGVTIIDDAENKGLLKKEGTIVEATSGNTGLGLALVGIKKGYSVILVMPDKMSPEKMNLLNAIGCEVIVCPTEVQPDDPRSYYSVAKRLAIEIDGAYLANQYYNPANPYTHYMTTGPEIWKQTGGKITHFVAGIGTGGTISGVAKYLKEQNPEIKIIGVDPEGSILAHYHKFRNTDVKAKSYKVEGVGEDIIPATVDFDLIDEVITVNDEESFQWTRDLAQQDGLLLGGSSGLAAAGAAKYFENTNENEFVVILFPDTGERYLGRIFSDSWLRANGFLPPPKTIREILSSKPANLLSLICVKIDQTLGDALEKIRKFRINQVVIEVDDNIPMFLPKSRIYNQLLSGHSPDESIDSVSLEKLSSLSINATLPELIHIIVQSGVVLIKENDKHVGILTTQDIIDNMAI